jgi:hypothetical protein
VSDASQDESASGSPADGVFGNLPRSRPGTRSPLRDEQQGASTASTTRAETESGAPTPGSSRRDSDPEPEIPPSEDTAAAEAGGGLEDLAWAGVAAAAEAATIGVRLASRAMEAVKDAGKRS